MNGLNYLSIYVLSWRINKILISWLANTDLKAAGQMELRPEEDVGDGSVLGALKSLSFMEFHLLHDQDQTAEQVDGFSTRTET